MKRPWLLLALGAAPLLAQSPATYADLEIVYRLDVGTRLTETRNGRLRLNSTTLAPALRRIVLPRLNATGTAELRDLVLSRAGQEIQIPAPVMQTTRGSFFWDVAEAQGGDEIRFSTIQPVDLTGSAAGGWWYANATTLPLPVESGLVRFIPPAGFAGSLDSIDSRNLSGGYEWRLDGIGTSARAARFVASSFKSWQEFSTWAVARCPVDGGNRVAALAQSRTAAEIAAQLADQVSVTDSMVFPCRPVEDVLASGTASPVEAATVFAAVLASKQIPVDRLLLSAGPSPEAVNPSIFHGAIVRVRSPEGTSWFDASHLERTSGGLRLTTGPESALPIQSSDARLLAPLVSWPEVRIEFGRLDARVEAAVTEAGTLQGTVTMEMVGAAESTFSSGSNQFGSFLKDRRLAAQPESTAKPGRATRRVVMREDQFVLPIERVKQTPLNAAPLVMEPVRLPDGGLYLGSPGTYREQIDLGTAGTRRLKSSQSLDVDRPYARYRSDAAVLEGRLIITREFELRRASVAASDAASAQSLVAQIREDQERPFALVRRGEVNWQVWADSIPPQQLNELAYKAYFPNGEYEAALYLLDRSTQLNPRDSYAWGLKAATRAQLGQTHGALDAYEKQVEIDPSNATARRARDLLLMPAGYVDRAIQSAQAQVDANPKDPAALATLTSAFVWARRWADAEVAGFRRTELAMSPAERAAAATIPVSMQACQGKLENPAEELQRVMGTNPSPVTLTAVAGTLADCGRELELADGYCKRFFDLMEPFVPSTTSNLLSLVAFPQTYAIGLSTCGRVKIGMGEVATGLERLRAAAIISPAAQVGLRAAQALWEAGYKEEAEQVWIDAFSFDAGTIEQIPVEIRERVRTAPRPTVFPGWYAVPDAADLVARTVEPDDELFFVVRADERGVVTRAFDLNIVTAPGVQTALRGMKVPVIRFDGRTIPTVHIVMVRNTRGNVEVFRSFAFSVIRMVQSTRQDLFRSPQPSR